MDDFQKDVITIIHSALNNEKGVISDDFNIENGIQLAIEHNIVSIFYEGAVLCGIATDNQLLSKLYKELYKTILIDARQIAKINELTKTFDENSIDYLPMKGIILKNFYPKIEMRAMGDADILIKLEQYPKIQKILKEKGFTFKYESDHELVWTSSSLFLELHKSVMTSYNKDFYKYFNTGWSLAVKSDGDNSKYEFKDEDFYIYIFVHFTKHYRISGIGIKHILDLWVYSKTHPNMDENYIYKVLKELRLFEFHQNVIDTLNVWFNNETSNDKTSLITNVIFSSGQYGTFEMSNINRTIRESKSVGSIRKIKIKKILNTTFPPYENMKSNYPILNKLPFLLPFVWIIRWFEIIIFKRRDISRYIQNLNAINKSAVDENQRALQYVGLDLSCEE